MAVGGRSPVKSILGAARSSAARPMVVTPAARPCRPGRPRLPTSSAAAIVSAAIRPSRFAGAGQYRQHRLPGQQVSGLHRVPAVRMSGAEVRICASTTMPPRGPSPGLRHGQGLSRCRAPAITYMVDLKVRERSIEHQPAGRPWRTAGGRQLIGHLGGERGVQDPGDLRALEPRHLQRPSCSTTVVASRVLERLGELQADVAAADHDGARRALVQLGNDLVHVGDVAQHVHPRLSAPAWRLDRSAPRYSTSLSRTPGTPCSGRAPPLPGAARCGSRPARSARQAPGSCPGFPGSAAAGCPGWTTPPMIRQHTRVRPAVPSSTPRSPAHSSTCPAAPPVDAADNTPHDITVSPPPLHPPGRGPASR